MHCPDSRCVPSQTPVELTYVSTSSPAHSGGKTPRTLQWNNLPAQGNLHWSWADPHSRARPLKFWPLRLLGDTVSHCEFFSPAIGCIPSVRKCVTALQKQHLSEITPLLSMCVHLYKESTHTTCHSQTETQRILTSLKSSGSSALGLYFGDTGVKGDS